MAGQLAIDFGNVYTVAAFWRQAARQVETLCLPGVTRPMPGTISEKGNRVFAAPSLIAYRKTNEGCLIGQEAVECDLAAGVFHDLQFAVVSGKRVYSQAGSRWLNGQDMARDYLSAIIRRAAQALGLGNEAELAFTVPLAACNSEPAWLRYRRWLEGAVGQAGFNRFELVEEPWAAAWGAGMKTRPGGLYIVVKLDAEFMEAAVVQAVNQTGNAGCRRHVRVLSYCSGWAVNDKQEPRLRQDLTGLVRRAMQEAARCGYSAEKFAGIVITGGNGKAGIAASVRDLYPAIPVYDRHPWSAAACGAAVLTAGVDGCGYLRYGYALRYLAEAGYHYRELAPQGSFYPSDGPVAEFMIKASYDGQQEFALLLYCREQCINEDDPLILTTGIPAGKGQAVICVRASLDGAGQLIISACEPANGKMIAQNKAAAKLM